MYHGNFENSALHTFQRQRICIVVATLALGVLSTMPAVGQGLTYVDANDDFVADGSKPDGFTFGPNANIAPETAFEQSGNINRNDGLWHLRDMIGSDGPGGRFIWEATGNVQTGDTGEDCPEITQTISGLTPGASYKVYAAYWSSQGESWSIRAGIASGNLTLYDRDGTQDGGAATPGIQAASAIWATPPTISGTPAYTEADRLLLLGYAGTAVADGMGRATVYIDDLPGNSSATRSWFDGVAYLPAALSPTLEATINRTNGQLTITNNTGAAVSFTSMSITSASQVLNAADWSSITANYDQGGGLDTDAWEITAPTTMPLPAFTGTLSEMESAGGSGGATLGNGNSINLGNVWNDSRFEDVQIQLTLSTGGVMPVTPSYTGPAHLLGDLDNSGAVGINDYKKFSMNLHTDVSTLGQAEAYLRGDMNGDLQINYADFAAFSAAFENAGNGSLAAALARIPEPSTVLLVVVAMFMMGSMRLINRRQIPELLVHSVSGPRPRFPRFIRETSSRTHTMTCSRLPYFVVSFIAAGAILSNTVAKAADVTMTAGDALGTSSFNTGTSWPGGMAPTAGNDYFTGEFNLRTPADGNSYTFAGDSLTVSSISADTTDPVWDPNNPANITGGMSGLWYKGTGNTGTITIDNLILDGGLVVALNGSADIFNLAGNLHVTANSYLYSRQGPMNISAAISGSASITNPGSDAATNVLRFMSSANTFTGDIINNGRFELPDNGRMNFVIGANGVNNSVSGTGASNVFDGDFVFDLGGASSTLGNSWTIVSAANRTFGDNFNVPGFFEAEPGIWVNGNYQFDESTATLTVTTPPELLTLKVNTVTGQVNIENDRPSMSFNMNYYEIRSPSGSLDLDAWQSIDGDIPTTTTTWEKAGGSSENLISETNLEGVKALSPTQNVSLGEAYAGTLPEHQDLEFYFGTKDNVGTLYRGIVEYVSSGGLAGDFNGNGAVENADLTLLLNNWAKPSTPVPAGWIGTPQPTAPAIDNDELTALLNNWGKSVGAGASSPVPEPSTFGLLVAAVMGLIAKRRAST
jgi:PEP-CTERM motif